MKYCVSYAEVRSALIYSIDTCSIALIYSIDTCSIALIYSIDTCIALNYSLEVVFHLAE